MNALPVAYSHTLVAASLTISMVAAYAAFCFSERIARSEGGSRSWWLGAGSMVMALGIWSMHFLGMLAVHVGMEVLYSLPLVCISFALAVFGSATALHLVSKPTLSRGDLVLGSVALGGGIGGMHYTGMAAMHCAAMQHYSIPIVALSVVVALVFSWGSLLITFRVRVRKSGVERLRMGGAVLMGAGIAAMHYTAMGAVTFMQMPAGMAMPAAAGDLVSVRQLGGIGVGATATIVLLGALLTAFLDRVTYRTLSEAHLQLSTAHSELARAQETLRQSEQALLEANRQLRELSIRDGLTRLFNRRHFDDVLGAEWRRARRSQCTLTLLMIDVDFFKTVNDEHGHAEGDDVLRRIGECLAEAVTVPHHLTARYGGEEFAVVLPHTPAGDGLRVAETVRRAVFELGIANERSPHGNVSVSVGVCSVVPRQGDLVHTLVEMADQALYAAKSGGRNRVEAGQFPIRREAMVAAPAAGAGDWQAGWNAQVPASGPRGVQPGEMRVEANRPDASSLIGRV